MKSLLNIASSRPLLALFIVALYASRTLGSTPRTKILVGTHHKVLTKYLTRVFSAFAAASRRSLSSGTGDRVDYGSDILIDHHSQFDFSKVNQPFVGVHVRRDPRDLLISAARYHLTSQEKWLHEPSEKLGGKTYQEYLRALPTLEEQLLFEIDGAGAFDIRQMLNWPYGMSGIAEWRYEDMVTYDGLQKNVKHVLAGWPLSALERRVLSGLFLHYSVYGRGSRGYKHIRNPRPSQWKERFSERVHDRFKEVFPGALERLGYDLSL
jgi:hypothetical protein